MKLLALLLANICTLSAVSPPDTIEPQVMHGSVLPVAAVGIPTNSEYQAAFGLWVAVHSEDATVTSFLVTIRYRLVGYRDISTVTKLILNSNPRDWNYEVVWTGQQASIITLSVASQVTKGVKEITVQ